MQMLEEEISGCSEDWERGKEGRGGGSVENGNSSEDLNLDPSLKVVGESISSLLEMGSRPPLTVAAIVVVCSISSLGLVWLSLVTSL